MSLIYFVESRGKIEIGNRYCWAAQPQVRQNILYINADQYL